MEILINQNKYDGNERGGKKRVDQIWYQAIYESLTSSFL